MNTFPLIISTPDGNVFEDRIAQISLRGTEGDLAVMAGHVPFVTAVKAGSCTVYMNEDDIRPARTCGGLLVVNPDEVTLMTGTFEFENGEN